MKDELGWTPEGALALENERLRGLVLHTATASPALRELVGPCLARYDRAWSLGAPRGDQRLRAEVAEVIARWTSGPPARASAREWAVALTMLGARSSGEPEAGAELLLRTSPPEETLRALCEMWTLGSSYDDPDYPKSEERLALFLRACPADDRDVHDASVSYGKATVTRYLEETLRRSDAARRDEYRQAAGGVWADATPAARVALAIATNDTERADELAATMFSEGYAGPTPRYAMKELGRWMSHPQAGPSFFPSYGFLARFGHDALSAYEQVLAGKPKWQRERLLEQLSNVRGPRTARLMAAHAERAPFTPIVRAYFAAYPQWLEKMLGDLSMIEHQKNLEALLRRTKRAKR